MKKRLLYFVFLMVLPLVYADPWFYNSKSLEVELSMGSELTIIPTSSDYRIEFVQVNLSFFPFDTSSQKMLSLETNPQAKEISPTAIFRWNNPSEKTLGFRIKSRIKTFNQFIKIKDKVPFPISEIPDDLEIYTKPSETIDSYDKGIIKLASTLAEGEDDLYVVVYKLGQWTKNNIKYDLSTLTAEVSQKASWVLDKREGVCDELTNLFIALNRALGIPARFISGVAYTDSPLFPEKWGAHGWAEVWFPDYGWIPYDVTYGEFGFVDPTHIKLKESLDANIPSTQYVWYGRDVDLDTNKLDIKANLKNIEGTLPEPVDLSLNLLKNAVGFGSYNLITATIKNLEDHYYTTELYLSFPRELEIQGEDTLQILLRPLEEKNVHWIVKVPEDLRQRYQYTFPIVIQSLRNVTQQSYFNSSAEDIVLSRGEVEDILKSVQTEEHKVYSKNVGIQCSLSGAETYQNQELKAICNVKNTGNVLLENLEVCFEKECKNTDLGINLEKTIEFDVDTSTTGKRNAKITINNTQVSKLQTMEIIIFDSPKIEIDDLKHPLQVRFNDTYNIKFSLIKKSLSAPQQVNAVIDHNGLQKRWFLDELKQDQKVEFGLKASELSQKHSRFTLLIIYEDKFGNAYQEKKEFIIELTELSLWQKIRVLFNGLLAMINRNVTVTVIGIVMVFIIVGYYTIRKKRNKAILS